MRGLNRNRRLGQSSEGGFTLIEAVFAVMIIGLGIASLMQLFASGTQVNHYGDSLSKAVFLAEELRAMTDDQPFNNLMSFDGQSYNGVDATGAEVPGLQQFTQTFEVTALNPTSFLPEIDPDPILLRITVNVSKPSGNLTTVSWLRSK